MLRGKILLPILMAFLAGACDRSPAPSASMATPEARNKLTPARPNEQTTSAALSCPAQEFDKFLVAFANDVEIQKAFVTQPLQSESVDASAEPEPKPVTKMLSTAELHFPLMPSSQQQASDGVKLSQTSLDSKDMEVKLVKEDTDYQMLFFFKNDGCWKLYRIRDDSL
ncbi:hypothetical protein [Dyella tabacisoli]|uniref:DUF4348 domain-containing protein n=1 Tax=Dyella tabacisoli TaxID=2282381 RepID=A0A369UQR8_9GAMM|nr:hypothetical protein [Dyella tabacisoli]RDD82807.1 hypothetical protein DVJ77_04625 [Dyella tabacisoli]